MLNGSLFKSVLIFSVPTIVSNLLSMLFNAADMIVLGIFCGSKYVGAVGATGSLVALIVNFFIGLSNGSGVVTAQAFGSGVQKNLERTVNTVIPTAFASGVLLTVLGLVFAKDLLVIMGTPADLIGYSTVYLRIYFCGIILRMIYVFSASVLRAVGDSQSPMIYLSIGGLLNVIFNLFFVLVLDMTVDGVAYGTIISEGISGLLCLRALMKRTDAAKFSFKKMCFDLKVVKSIFAIGLPAGIQSSMFSISNVLVQSSVNSFGSVVVTGNSAASNISNFTAVTTSAFSITAGTFMGQNIGAKKYDRVKQLPRICLMWMFVVSFPISLLSRVFAHPLLSFYISDSPAALEVGVTRLTLVTLTYVLCGVFDVYTGLMRGIGKSVSSMIVAISTACVFRTLYLKTLFMIPQIHTIEWLYAVYPASWILADIADVILFRRGLRKKIALANFKREQAEGSRRLHMERLAEKQNAENAPKEETAILS